jgi:hypothetical protein
MNGLGIMPGRQFVMAALSGQNRPGSSDARPVKRASVLFLSIAVVIVAAPGRTLRQIVFENVIHDRDGIPHERIVRRADAQPHQMKKIAADHVPGRAETAAVGDAEHCGIGVGVRIGRALVRGIDANVVTRETLHQFTGRGDSPFFNMRSQPVRILQNKLRGSGSLRCLANPAAQTKPAITVASVEGE